MYPINITAVCICLPLHYLLRNRVLDWKELLGLGLFEGLAIYYALIEDITVGGLFLACIAGRVIYENWETVDLTNILFYFLGASTGALVANTLDRVFGPNMMLFREDWVVERRTIDEKTHRRRRSSRTHIAGAPDPDPPSIQLSRRNNHNVADEPVQSQWEEMQKPISGSIGLEREVLELRRRASAAEVQRRKLQEEQKWAWSQSNRARAFQLGWEIKRFQGLSESLNKEAEQRITKARQNSLDAKTGEIYVQGLSTNDAIALAEQRVKRAHEQGDSFVRISLGEVRVTSKRHGTRVHSARRTGPVIESHFRK
ncbi:hypothetical protein FRC02_012460 [Tulasnella sp. 418]|nr:hypothetical protein FRC02_012460 [Tulasnella sp. 418]